MRKAKALAGLQERLGSYEPSLLAVDVPLRWRWRHGNQRQSDPAILTSSDLNTLYNAPTILEIMKDLGVVDFPELLGTRTVSHRLLWNWNDSHTIFFLPEQTRACKHTNTILMYKKAFNKLHAAQRQFLRALNYLNRESTRVLSCEFILVHSSLTMISLRKSDSCQFSYLYMNLFLLVP